jgi:excisionase family DNA binding protein
MARRVKKKVISRRIDSADELLTAPEVAKIVAVDLKTIHNWVNRGSLKAFRTPGRHLRIRRGDVLGFLREFGYPIPEWLLLPE